MHNHLARSLRVWNLGVAAAAIVAAVDVPLRLVLESSGMPRAGGVRWFLAVVFAADLLLQLYLSGFLGRRRTGRSPESTAYGWPRFFVDLCAAIPFGALAVPPALELLRLLKLTVVARRIRRWQSSQFKNPNLIRLVLGFASLTLVAHWISCGWLAQRGVPAGLSPISSYLRALYWCVTTLTTVGYGDITPVGDGEVLYAMLVMMLGVGVYGYVIGNVAALLANIDPARVRHRELVDKVTVFMNYREVPAKLQRRILDYYEYLWEKRLGYDESAAVAGLPPTLRAELSLHLNRDIIHKVPFFKEADDAFVSAMALEMRPMIFMPGDYIMRAGELGDEMYFISQGTVEVVSADEQEIYATLSSGDFFGEIAMLVRQPRTATVRSVEYSDVYVLGRTAFDRVLARHPEVADQIRAIAREREKDNTARSDANGGPSDGQGPAR